MDGAMFIVCRIDEKKGIFNARHMFFKSCARRNLLAPRRQQKSIAPFKKCIFNTFTLYSQGCLRFLFIGIAGHGVHSITQTPESDNSNFFRLGKCFLNVKIFKPQTWYVSGEFFCVYQMQFFERILL